MTRQIILWAGATSLAASLSVPASQLFGTEYNALTPLYSVNQSSGLLTSIGASGVDDVGDLTSDTRPGSHHVWGVRIDANELVEFNPVTGLAAAGVLLDSAHPIVSLAFDPVGGVLYGTTSSAYGDSADRLYTIDPNTGDTTLIGTVNFNFVYALGFSQGGNLFGIEAGANRLLSINTATGAGTLIASIPLTTMFDIASRPEDDVMFLADSVTASLYTVNTANGALSSIGGYGSFVNLAGLAFLPPETSGVPEASTVVAGAGFAALLLAAEFRRRCRGARA